MEPEISQRDESTNPVTLKIIMHGKEVGSIIGKKGEIVKRFREESGAKINISDGSCPERIVTVSGNIQSLYKAFSLICAKVEEFQDVQNVNASNGQKLPITLKLVIPASQCGSLIGKGGSKIKEIRETSGATIQVASDMLPSSTERAVLLTGMKDSLTQCIYHICSVIQESPPKGTSVVPYRPRPYIKTPLFVTAGNQGFQTYAFQGFPTNNATPADVSTIMTSGCGGPSSYSTLLLPQGMGITPFAVFDPIFKNGHLPAAIPHLIPPAISEIGKIGTPLSNLTALGVSGFTSPTNPTLNPASIAAFTGSSLHGRPHDVTHEMIVSNDLIGCVIGKGGTKIAEIRQLSGAVIRISNCDDRENFENVDRTITISGNADAVALAEYLINMSLEQQKLNVALQNFSTTTTTTTSSSNIPGMISDIQSTPQAIANPSQLPQPQPPQPQPTPIPELYSPPPLLANPNTIAAITSNNGTKIFNQAVTNAATVFAMSNLGLHNAICNTNPFLNNHINCNNIDNNLTNPLTAVPSCSNSQQFIIRPHQILKQNHDKANIFRLSDVKYRPY